MSISPRPKRYPPHRETHARLNHPAGRRSLSVADFSVEDLSAVRRKRSRRLFIMIVTCWGIACAVIVLDSALGSRHRLRRARQPASAPVRDIPSPDSSFINRTAAVAGLRRYLDDLCRSDPGRYLRVATTGFPEPDSLPHTEYGLLPRNP